jgi:hypothetical protein
MENLNIIENFKNEMRIFKKKAQIHIKYLKFLMFIIVIILNELKIFTNYQILYLSFIIIFNIAFSQNLINNIPKIKN